MPQTVPIPESATVAVAESPAVAEPRVALESPTIAEVGDAADGAIVLTDHAEDFSTPPCVLTPSDLGRLRAFAWGDDTAGTPIAWTRRHEGLASTACWWPDGATRAGVTVTFEDPYDNGYLEYGHTHPWVIHSRAIRIEWRFHTRSSAGDCDACYEWVDAGTPARRAALRRQTIEFEGGIVGAAMATCGVVEAVESSAVRAEALLMSLLDGHQRASFKQHRTVIVRADSGRRYRLKLGMIGNVEEIDDNGKALLRLCVHPVGVPDADVVATQKLLIETDEEAFRAMANITDVATGRMVQRSKGA